MENEDLKQAKKKYDTVCKKVLSQKPVLAKILKSCVSEYKDYDEKFIEEHCIEGNTISLSTGVNPDESYPHITGDDTVDKLEQESTVYYDIRFNTLIPGTDEYIKLIVNIEAQTIYGKKEPPLSRAVYYVSRLISAQKGTEFMRSDYEKIRKVYSIWICINGEDALHNTVTEYCIHEKNMIGCYKGKRERYDLLDIIVIGLGGLEKKNDETIIGFLDNILDRELEPLMRKKVLKERYDIATNYNMMEAFDDMCNLSDGVYLEGKAAGLAENKIEMLKQFMSNNHTFDEFIELFNIKDEDEIKFLKENIQVQ